MSPQTDGMNRAALTACEPNAAVITVVTLKRSAKSSASVSKEVHHDTYRSIIYPELNVDHLNLDKSV